MASAVKKSPAQLIPLYEKTLRHYENTNQPARADIQRNLIKRLKADNRKEGST